jgi:hypothetical protein
MRIGIFLILAALIAGMVGCSGNGSQNLVIRDWYDLDAIRDNPAGNHILMNDIDSTTAGYNELAGPAANGGEGWLGIWYFVGTFDGQGYEIRDLFIGRPVDTFVGLFSYVGGTGVVKNIGVVNADVSGSYQVGALVGQNKGTLLNCYSSGSVVGDQWVGGLVGVNDGWADTPDPVAGTVTDCYSDASVSGTKSGIGGLVGNNDAGTLNRSYSTGSVTGYGLVGGLAGVNGGLTTDSYSTGSVTGDQLVGGLMGMIGLFYGTVSNSHYDYDEVLINGENVITVGALSHEDFEEWLADGKSLPINERLSEEDGYYVITDVADFTQLLAFGQNGSLKFRLTNDLDLAAEPDFYIPYLAGEFDGDGHKISNLSVGFNFSSDVGSFGYLAPGGKISQVGVENANITAGRDIGGLVGVNCGAVDGAYCAGTVNGIMSVGGLVGWNRYPGTVSNSYATSSVTGDSQVGGLVGLNFGGTVGNSCSTGNVTGVREVGGLVGYTEEQYQLMFYFSGPVIHDISSQSTLALNEEAFVSNAFWDIQASGQATSDGGTGKNTTEMREITTFSGAGWDIIAVGGPSSRNPAYLWNIVNELTYPFLSWQPI